MLRHTDAGELDVLVACDGVLGKIVGRRGGAAALVGPVSLVALALSRVPEIQNALGPFRHSIRPSVGAVAAALPTGASALLLLVEQADARRMRHAGMLPYGVEAVAISFAAALEPWLVARIDVDLRVEPPDAQALIARAS